MFLALVLVSVAFVALALFKFRSSRTPGARSAASCIASRACATNSGAWR